MIIGTVTETFPGERRVAIVPAVVPALRALGAAVVVEAGCGGEAGFPDGAYEAEGAEIAADRGDVLERATVLCQVRTHGANPERGRDDLPRLRAGQVVIGLADPLADAGPLRELAATGATVLALELIPRITRAQGMDVLSSQATIAGYRAVLLAATALPRMFPMMMTAAGTLAPARAFVIGAGVAGLQAIATSRRLGAVVRAYDVRPAVREQVESLGATFVEMDLATERAEARGGYAAAMDEDFYRRQRELMARTVAESDVVVTTAAVPGRTAPMLVTDEMVAGMAPGSVVVDLAAERGGNVEPSRPGEAVVAHGVTVLGPTNLPAEVPHHASLMFARNVLALLEHLVADGAPRLEDDDEITEATLLARSGEIVQRRVREALGLDAAPAAP